MTKHSINSQLPIGCDTPSFFPPLPAASFVNPREKETEQIIKIHCKAKPTKQTDPVHASEREREREST